MRHAPKHPVEKSAKQNKTDEREINTKFLYF